MFDWIPFYEELAKKLLKYKDKPDELASVIYKNFDRKSEISFLHDSDGSDYAEIDPFTVYGIFNRRVNNRFALTRKMKEVFKIKANLPTTFDGIPIQNNLNSAFCCFSKDRSANGKDIERFWLLFEEAQKNKPDMEAVFDAVLKQYGIKITKLTMGLFYICPNKYMALDKNNREYLKKKYGINVGSINKMNFIDYEALLDEVKEKMSNKEIKEQTIPEFSSNACMESYSTEDDGINPEFYDEIVDLLRYKKNVVIEGAPGVGKTYELPRIITRLCFPDLPDYSESVLKEKMKWLRENKRVEYVTFHQSMDYEEFVEGIRPHTNENGNVFYEVESGIFKRICEAAKKPIVEDNSFKIKDDANVWKVSLFRTGDNPIRTECMKNNHIRIGWDNFGEDISQVDEANSDGRIILNAFYDRMQIGDIVFSCYSSRSIDAIGVVTGDVEWHDEYENLKRVRKVEWLIKDINEDIYEMNGGTAMTSGTVYRLKNIELGNVFAILNKYGVGKQTEVRKNDRPYVLVIDEINRGNVSKIFGELITLIESDKRTGRKAETEVTLPYSKTVFSVPDNVYIIGTMNTADRSIDSLDYAMRRRFAFVKYKPMALALDNFNVDLFEMVSRLFIDNYDEYKENSDVELIPSPYLSDDILPEDVWIGQSYFIKDDDGKDCTRLKIEYEIIPILKEYIKDGIFKDVEKVNEVIKSLREYESEDD
ncbi:MAG: AAA family ATPase [Bacteroidaceae bacterium]|nr:AAA family ATPase [Bacteroidaceae bacterium]